MRGRTALAVAAASALGARAVAGQAARPPLDPPAASEVRVLRHAGGDADAFSNAYLVETPRGVVVVDGHLTTAGGAAVRAALDSIGKPLLAVLLTHAHPDHYGGVAEVVRGRQPVRVVATLAVDRAARAADSANDAAIRRAGLAWPSPRVLPNTVVADGRALTLGGLRFTAHALGAGESEADAYWTVDGPLRAAFVGDLTVGGVAAGGGPPADGLFVHPFTAAGHTRAWIAAIDRAAPALAASGTLYPGHGAPGDAALLAATRRYLGAYRGAVASLARGADSLTADQTRELARRMAPLVPGDRLARFVARGANPVAAELARERRDGDAPRGDAPRGGGPPGRS